MKIGYARISTVDQNIDMQIDALKEVGCEKIITDKMSGGKKERPGLKQLLEFVREGDTIIVWRLDRLGRSLKDLLDLINEFLTKGIYFQSLQESIDTTTPSGKLMFHMFACLAEFERNVTIERCKAGLEAARARGRFGGRPFALDEDKTQLLVDLYQSKKYSTDQICKMVGISRPSIYRYLRKEGKF